MILFIFHFINSRDDFCLAQLERDSASKCSCLMLCNFLETVTTLFVFECFLFVFIFFYTCICLSFDFCLLRAYECVLPWIRLEPGFIFVCAFVEVVWLCHYSGFIIQSNALCLGLPGPGASMWASMQMAKVEPARFFPS